MMVKRLLLAIVQAEDAEAVTSALTQGGLRVTRISSVGGFLAVGNVTLLIGLERDEVACAIALLAKTCRTRPAFVNAATLAADWRAGAIAPLEVEVGGATVLVLPVVCFARLSAREAHILKAQETTEASMKLILAIVSQEQSRNVLDALIAAQYRATLISTTGGFLRKGNATLLIGVEPQRLDDALVRIHEACRSQEMPAASEACATVFVLDVEQYQRV
jgi:uncharacterized protein YaaQ